LGIQIANLLGAPGVLIYAVTSAGRQTELVSTPGRSSPRSMAGRRQIARAMPPSSPGQTVHIDSVNSDGSRSAREVTLGELLGSA